MYLSDVPGFGQRYAEELAALRERRLMVWAAHPMGELCGLPVVPVTLGAMVDLQLAGNAFFDSSAEGIGPEDLLQLFWRLHPDFATAEDLERMRRGERRRIRRIRNRVTKAVLAMDYLTATKSAAEHLQSEMEDTPFIGGASGPVYDEAELTIAIYTDALAAEYGWTPERIRELPIRMAHHLVRRMMTRKQTPDHPYIPPTPSCLGRVQSDLLRQLNSAGKGKN